jgi:hypothetical protein
MGNPYRQLQAKPSGGWQMIARIGLNRFAVAGRRMFLPVSAQLDSFTNARTEADPAWTPLFATPQHPQYLSARDQQQHDGECASCNQFVCSLQ